MSHRDVSSHGEAPEPTPPDKTTPYGPPQGRPTGKSDAPARKGRATSWRQWVQATASVAGAACAVIRLAIELWRHGLL
jgi:hypothetical protein